MFFGNDHKYFLAAIVESSQDSIVTIDLERTITSWNTAAELLYGYTAAEAIGQPLTMLTLPKEFVQLVMNVDEIAHGRRVEVFESERLHKNKGRLFLEVVLSPVKNEQGEIIGVSTVARDLTRLRDAEKARHDREVMAGVLAAQEGERARIARDLHDELGQHVTSLRFQLRTAKESCRDEATCAKIDEMELIAQQIDNSVDFIAWELRPAALQEVPLFAAVDNYVTQWSRRAGVKAQFDSFGSRETAFTPEVETALYRIVQEALNNTHKHADAANVQLFFDRRGEDFVLIIADDGRGFDPEDRVNGGAGMGLIGMKERAALVGGTAEIESAPGRGTTIYVRVPAASTADPSAQRATTQS